MKELLEFIKKLEQNNNRDWFQANKPEYENSKKYVQKLVNNLEEELKKYDDLDQVKIFRIFRDVRFSSDKTPYKTHFGATISRKKPYLRGGYYLHLKPNNESFIAGGFWEPNKDDLLRIRKEFEFDPQTIENIMSQKEIKNTFGEIKGDELKTAPKGFPKDLPNISLVRKTQFYLMKKYTDKEVLSDNFVKNISLDFKNMKPFLNYISDILRTNLNGEELY